MSRIASLTPSSRLQVLGNAKGVVATIVSILLFRNPVSATGMVGYTITVFGVIAYSEAKKRATKQQHKRAMLDSENAGETSRL